MNKDKKNRINLRMVYSWSCTYFLRFNYLFWFLTKKKKKTLFNFVTVEPTCWTENCGETDRGKIN